MEHGTLDRGHGTWNLGPWAWNMEPWAWNMEPWTLDMEHGTLDMGHGTWNLGHGTWNLGPWTWNMEPWTWWRHLVVANDGILLDKIRTNDFKLWIDVTKCGLGNDEHWSIMVKKKPLKTDWVKRTHASKFKSFKFFIPSTPSRRPVSPVSVVTETKNHTSNTVYNCFFVIIRMML